MLWWVCWIASDIFSDQYDIDQWAGWGLCLLMPELKVIEALAALTDGHHI